VLGAAGGIGQPLSLLLKMNSNVTSLSLYDIVHSPGVAADLSHIPTSAKVSGYKGLEQLAEAVTGADVIVVPAGMPRKPGMTRDDLFNTNASIVATLATVCAKAAPKAHMLIISNPVNSTVPIVAEVYKKAGVYDPKRLFGVSTLDVLRAQTFAGEAMKVDPASVNVPVVGGHAGTTIMPLLSRVKGLKLTDDELAKMTYRIQFGGDEVVKAKDGAGSATLSMAVAGARFTSALLRALKGEKGIVECAFVQSTAVPSVPFFATEVELSKDGVGKVHELGALTKYEKENFDKMLPDLKSQIEKGIEFAKAFVPK
jgi:malate dehydrogenase